VDLRFHIHSHEFSYIFYKYAYGDIPHHRRHLREKFYAVGLKMVA